MTANVTTAPTSLPTKPRYSQISIAGRRGNDNEKIYDLLESVRSEPARLDSVKEAVVRLVEVRGGSCFPTHTDYTKPYQEQEAQRTLPEDHPIRHALRVLGDLTIEQSEITPPADEIAKHITWYEPSVRRERERRRRQDPKEADISIYTGVLDGQFAAYAAPLLLLHSPNVENLTYSSCPSAYHASHADASEPYREHLLRTALIHNNYGLLPGKHLQKLRHVRLQPEQGIWYEDGDTYSHMDILGELRLFHRLPSIESISIEGVERHGGADAVEYFPPHSSNIKRIHVTHSILDNYAELIRTSKALEELTYTIGGLRTRDGGYYSVSGKKLGKALLDQSTTLQKLDLDVDEILGDHRYDRDEEDFHDEMEQYDEDEEPYWRDQWFKLDEKLSTGPLHVFELPDTRHYGNSIGSLHDFPALTHLSIGIQLLLDTPEELNSTQNQPLPNLADRLPPNLEFLLVRGYKRGEDQHYDDIIQAFLNERSAKLPSLKEVEGIEEYIPSALRVPEGSDRPGWGFGEDWEKDVKFWEPEEVDEAWVQV